MNKIFFGTIHGPLARMQEIPCMVTPMSTNRNRYVNSSQFESGGTSIVSSADSAKSYDLSFMGDDLHDATGIDQIMHYYNNQYGDGLIYFADPALLGEGKNVLRANWATPALIELGYQNIANVGYLQPSGISFVNAPTTNGSPGRSASWVSDTSIKYFHIAVPHGYRLWFGGRGNAATVAVRNPITHATIASTPISAEGGAVLYSNSTPASLTSSNGAVVALTVGASSGFGFRVQALNAILLPSDQTPTMTGDHIPGMGISGMRFSNESMPYEYRSTVTGLRSLSVELTEVEEWL